MSVDWTGVSAIATGTAAFGTFVAAAVTGWMALMTRNSVRQTQEHHRDAFRPLVIFMPYDGIDPKNRKELIKFSGPSEGNQLRHLLLNGTLQNIGVGPALNLRLRLALMNPNDVRVTCELSPMKINESRQGPKFGPGDGPFPLAGQWPLAVPVELSQGFTDTDFLIAQNSAWSVIFEYEDVFGQRFRTCHASSRHAPWTMAEIWRQDHWVPA
jgi:hypothetical protein